MDFLSIENISKRERDFSLKQIHFTQARGQKLALMGATGSGKSTLLKIIAGLLQPDDGAVIFNGEKVKGPDEKLLPGHPQIAYLSQHFELRNNYRVKDELSYTNKVSDEEAAAIFAICRITHLLERWTHQLSGGERQRIAMARQLISAPQLFLLDEPFSNLDRPHKEIIKSVIDDMGEKLSITCMLVSHEPHDVLPWADEILVLQDGALVQKAAPEELYNQPANAYVAGLLGSYNLIEAKDLHLFEAWGINDSDGKSLIIRPEHLHLDFRHSATVSGVIRKVSFYGAFYEVQIRVAHLVIVVHVEESFTKPGDVVHVRFNGGAWFV